MGAYNYNKSVFLGDLAAITCSCVHCTHGCPHGLCVDEGTVNSWQS